MVEPATKPQLEVVKPGQPRRTPRPAAEAALLGAFLDAHGMMKTSAGDLLQSSALCPSDFLDPQVRSAMTAVCSLAERGRAVDATTTFLAARAVGALQEDALGWLQRLQTTNALDRSHFDESARLFREASRGLAIAGTLRQIAAEMEAHRRRPWQVAEQLDALARQLDVEWSPSKLAADDLMAVFSEWERVGEPGGKPIVLPSGIAALDRVCGGWTANLNLIIGQASVGKSALLASAILAQLERGCRVGLFSLEDGSAWLTRRLVAKCMDVPVGEVAATAITEEQRDLGATVGERWYGLLQNLVTFSCDGLNVRALAARSAEWIRQKGVQCIYVDHVGELEHLRRNGENESSAVGRTYSDLRSIARRYQVPVVVVAHTTRVGDDHSVRPPRMDEIANSAWAERRARKIIGLWEKQGELRATVLKNTEGERDVTVALSRLRKFALVDPATGELVDLAAERRREQEERERVVAEKAKKRRDALASEAADRRKKQNTESATGPTQALLPGVP